MIEDSECDYVYYLLYFDELVKYVIIFKVFENDFVGRLYKYKDLLYFVKLNLN